MDDKMFPIRVVVGSPRWLISDPPKKNTSLFRTLLYTPVLRSAAQLLLPSLCSVSVAVDVEYYIIAMSHCLARFCTWDMQLHQVNGVDSIKDELVCE